jgi:sterol desaturase/sphingolipid hydroxylase (fatty acid hydroxylase superfamily)
MNLFLLYVIPIFILSIVIESWSLRQKQGYLLKDTAASLSMGVGFLLVSGLCSLFVYPLFLSLNRHAFFQIPETWVGLFQGKKVQIWPFVLLLFLEDFCYYWFHRTSHMVRFFWCSHETHHSSEYYNLGTALRQPWVGSPFTWIFWAPLALLGFHAEDILFQISLNLFYQFWVHTEYTKSFGILDYVMNTPSHHRVHHGTNIPYLDKNYAGIFIIWDRIFGTFISEKEKVAYGVLHNLNSFQPIFIGFHMVVDLVSELRVTPGFKNKLKTIFYPPGWKFDGTGKTSRDLQMELSSKMMDS